MGVEEDAGALRALASKLRTINQTSPADQAARWEAWRALRDHLGIEEGVGAGSIAEACARELQARGWVTLRLGQDSDLAAAAKLASAADRLEREAAPPERWEPWWTPGDA